MVGDGLIDCCYRWLEIRHNEYCVTSTVFDKRCAELHHGVLPEMTMKIGLAIVRRDD